MRTSPTACTSGSICALIRRRLLYRTNGPKHLLISAGLVFEEVDSLFMTEMQPQTFLFTIAQILAYKTDDYRSVEATLRPVYPGMMLSFRGFWLP